MIVSTKIFFLFTLTITVTLKQSIIYSFTFQMSSFTHYTTYSTKLHDQKLTTTRIQKELVQEEEEEEEEQSYKENFPHFYDANRSVQINPNPWKDYTSILPLQYYKNAMNPSLYQRWLRCNTTTSSSTIPTPDHYHPNGEQYYPERNHDQNTFLTTKDYTQYQASQPLKPIQHLHILYIDSHIIVCNKPSGILSVPGPRRNPSLANLVYDYFGKTDEEQDDNNTDNHDNITAVDDMIVHRLDMDTSGVLIYARSKKVLGILHEAFRNKSNQKTRHGKDKNNSKHDDDDDEFVWKKYEALVCGHVQPLEGNIDLPLMRDAKHPPFMCVATPDSLDEKDHSIQQLLQLGDKDLNLSHKHKGYTKMISKAPKESLTLFRVLSREYLNNDLPVTRLELIPITGRTHQLRVHCAAIGHPIVGDNIYGYNGEGSPNGGFSDTVMDQQFLNRAALNLQQNIHLFVQDTRMRTNLCDGVESCEGRKFDGRLCLHARQLHIFHPISKAPIIFEADPPF